MIRALPSICVLLMYAVTVAEPRTGNIDHGTLNLILANRNGFVIAADSRRSSETEYSDDSQKLFRVGPKSAAVISGFASWVSGGSPIDFQVAASLREEFSDPKWISKKSDLADLPPTLASLVAEQLSLFGGVLASGHVTPDRLGLRMLAASLQKSRIILMQIDFLPTIHEYGPFALRYPQFEVRSQSSLLKHFEYRSAGIDDVARAVMEGRYPTEDPRILEYYRARDADELDLISLERLEKLAAAILAETRHTTRWVGGPDQIGVFPRRGAVRWRLPELPSSRQKRKSTIVNVGASYSRDGFTHSEHAQMVGKNVVDYIAVSLLQPFEEPFTQVYLGGIIRDVPVVLDGNVFVGDQFVNVHFRYGGGQFYFVNNNVKTCWLHLSKNAEMPQFLSKCTILRGGELEPNNALGSPVRLKPVGCVSRSPDGHVIIKKTGRQHGFDCKKSRVEVPKAVGPFQLGGSATQYGNQ